MKKRSLIAPPPFIHFDCKDINNLFDYKILDKKKIDLTAKRPDTLTLTKNLPIFIVYNKLKFSMSSMGL